MNLNDLFIILKNNSEKEHLQLESELDSYSSEELFKKGKKYLQDEKYILANLCFKATFNRNYRIDKSSLYGNLSYAIIHSEMGNLKNKEINNEIVKIIGDCAAYSTIAYRHSGDVSYEELLDIERFMNRINIEKLKFDKDSYRYHFYYTFKNLAIDEFLRKNEKHNKNL